MRPINVFREKKMDLTNTIIVSVVVALIYVFIIRPKKEKQAEQEKKDRQDLTDVSGVEYSKDKQTLVKAHSVAKDYDVPVGVSSIQDCAFQGRSELETINLGTVYHIGGNAFQNCINLKTVVFPKHMGSIGSYAFYGCKSLQQITVPDGIKEIKRNTFSKCTNLHTVVLADSVTYIGQNAFEGCESLAKIVVPKGTSERIAKLLPELSEKLIEE